MSMIISFISVILGLHNRHRYFHKDTEIIKYCGKSTLTKIIVLTLDITLKLSVVILSVILFGIETTLIGIFLFVILLMVPNYVYFYNVNEKHRFWYSVEIFHLVLTNLSFELDFGRQNNSNNFKLKEVANRTSLYVIFLFGLRYKSCTCQL